MLVLSFPSMRIWSIVLIVVLAAGAVAFSWIATAPPQPPEREVGCALPTRDDDPLELQEARVRADLEALENKLSSITNKGGSHHPHEIPKAKLEQLRRDKAAIELRIREHRRRMDRTIKISSACQVNPLGKDCMY